MGQKVFHIEIVDNSATVRRVYAVKAASPEEAVSKYIADEHDGCLTEEVQEWDQGDEEDWTIEEVK